MLANQSYSEPFQNLFPNHSEPIRKTFLISFDGNRLKINPTRFNSNKSEIGLIQAVFSIQVNRKHSDLLFIRTDLSFKFGSYRPERILIQFNSDWFLTNSHWTRFKTFFEVIRNGSETDFGIARIRSDWISFRNFRQSNYDSFHKRSHKKSLKPKVTYS